MFWDNEGDGGRFWSSNVNGCSCDFNEIVMDEQKKKPA
jgi:hypothetical protein